MKEETKLLISFIPLLFFGILYQIFMGNKGAFIVFGMVVSSIMIGWYFKCSKITAKTENSEEKK